MLIKDLKRYEGQKKIMIIGSGFGGILAGIHLKKAGLQNFVIYDKNQEFGGTWYENTYPGFKAAVQSQLFSFSFEQNPDWKENFSTGQDVLQYQLKIVKKYGLRKHFKGQMLVKKLEYNQTEKIWQIEILDLKNNKILQDSANFVISASGPLNILSYPKLDGLNEFQGKTFHSAHWDHKYNLKGKNVAVIGNGGSGIQFMPEIAPNVQKLISFQRTPNYIIPKLEVKIPNISEPIFGQLVMKRKLKQLFKGDKKYLIDLLYPNYSIGCKRVLVSNNYLEMFLRENVILEQNHIKKITKNSIITLNGTEYKVDCIIFGTGYETRKISYQCIGKNRVDLNQQWNGVPKAYLGITNPQYPNHFQILGPNSVLGQFSALINMECQMNYISQVINYVYQNNIKEIDVKQRVFENYYNYIKKKSKKSVWIFGGCTSFYVNKGELHYFWVGGTFSYWKLTRKFNPENYITN